MNRYILTALVALFILPLSACRIVQDGEAGVSRSFGTISPDELNTGVAFAFPIARSVSIYSTKIQEMTQNFKVPTSDGMIVEISATLLASRVPAMVAEQTMTIQGNPWETVVLPIFRSSIRDNVALYPIESVYQGEGRERISLDTATDMQEQLKEHGFAINSIQIRDLVLPPAFKEAVEAKLAAEQAVQQKTFLLQQAHKDAEIEVARAEGAAKAQEIVRSTLSNQYLQYLWIKNLENNANVIYVSTENNIPIFKQAGR